MANTDVFLLFSRGPLLGGVLLVIGLGQAAAQDGPVLIDSREIGRAHV